MTASSTALQAQRGRLLLVAMQLSLVLLVLACSCMKPCACYQADNTASASSKQNRVLHPSSSSAGQVPGRRRELLQEHVVPKTKEGTQAAPTAATTSHPVPSPIPQPPPAFNNTEDLQRLKAQIIELNKQQKVNVAAAERAQLEMEKSLNQTQNDSDPIGEGVNDTLATLNQVDASIRSDTAKLQSQSSGTPGFKASTTAALQAAGLAVFVILIAL